MKQCKAVTEQNARIRRALGKYDDISKPVATVVRELVAQLETVEGASADRTVLKKIRSAGPTT